MVEGPRPAVARWTVGLLVAEEAKQELYHVGDPQLAVVVDVVGIVAARAVEIERQLAEKVANDVVEAKLAVADSSRSDRPMDHRAAVRVLLQDGSRSVRAVALYYAGEIGIHCDPQDLSRTIPEDSADSSGERLRLQDRALTILRELYEKQPGPAGTPVSTR